MTNAEIKRFLPWIVATVLLMEQLDATIVNTAIPAMALSLSATPLSLKAVVTSYIIALAVGIPISGWIADRFGTRRVFALAIAAFTLSSILCGLALSVPMLVAARVLQGLAAALMMPVGRLAIVRAFPKSELLHTMNFIVMPALIGPLLGPTVGGLIVHWLSWREIFFVNVPIGIVALVLVYRYMPDYRGTSARPLDRVGLVLFSGGTALLSWLLEIFGEHELSTTSAVLLGGVALGLMAGYWLHARTISQPLLRTDLFGLRTFRASVAGGFVTRLGVGGLPFLLPLLYQIGLGYPAWQSGLLMMPTAAAAMLMKLFSERLLKRLGYRVVLIWNTLLIGLIVACYSLVTEATPLSEIVFLSFCFGFFNSLQYSAINSIAYADVDADDASQASTVASTFQQLARSFGLAAGGLLTAFYLGDIPQSNQPAVTQALHDAFLTVGAFTFVSSLAFWSLRPDDGKNVSGQGTFSLRIPSEVGHE